MKYHEFCHGIDLVSKTWQKNILKSGIYIYIYIYIYIDVYWQRRVRLLFFAFNVCFLEDDLGKGSAAAALFFQVFYGFMQVILLKNSKLETKE